MMPLFGWRSVFIFGGTVPLVIAMLMIWGMPESLQFLVGQRTQSRPTGALAEEARSDDSG